MAGASGVYVGSGVVVAMNPAPVVYIQVFHPASGPERHLRRKAEDVALVARVLAPKRSGRLVSSIRVDQNRDELGRYAFGFKVYTPLRYGYYVHEGTEAHWRVKELGKYSFRGTGSRSGSFVVVPAVFYRKRDPKPFLQKALSGMAG